ncbi:MAG: RHS repeat-associated core domain-containing protein [Blastocatellia bacterium]|nr:RHS repeat-associated core domain-containing protein [Blastocatellia bacterium]
MNVQKSVETLKVVLPNTVSGIEVGVEIAVRMTVWRKTWVAYKPLFLKSDPLPIHLFSAAACGMLMWWLGVSPAFSQRLPAGAKTPNASHSSQSSVSASRPALAQVTTAKAGRSKRKRIKSAPNQVTYGYDGDGNIVSKTVNGVTTRYLVAAYGPDGLPQIYEEIVDGQVQRVVTHGYGPISQRQLVNGQWKTSFYITDGNNSVRALTDANGNVTDTFDYDAFGNLIGRTGTTPNPYLFAGQRYEPEAGLYNLRERMMSPNTGRFFTMDPFEGRKPFPSSLHKYTYAHNDPVNHWDPTGFEATLTGLTVNQAVGTTTNVFPNLVSGFVNGFPVQDVSVELLDGLGGDEFKTVGGFRQVDFGGGGGVKIHLGAKTQNRAPVFPLYRWVQCVRTNEPIDAANKNVWAYDPGGKLKPYYYSQGDEEEFNKIAKGLGFDKMFFDLAQRPFGMNKKVEWDAELSLVGVKSYGTKMFQEIVRVSYGFSIDSYQTSIRRPVIRKIQSGKEAVNLSNCQ